MKINDVTNASETITTFIKYFEQIVDRVLNRNQIRLKNVEIDDFKTAIEELNDFEKEFEKVILFKTKMIFKRNHSRLLFILVSLIMANCLYKNVYKMFFS